MASEPKKPVDTAEFWHYRLLWSHSTGRGLHTAIYDIDPDTWNNIQNETAGIMQRHVQPYMRLLDAGCGYGALYDLIPPHVTYHGIDLSPDLISIARMRQPAGKFEVGNLAGLPFSTNSFEFAVCRSIKRMVIDNLGQERWDSIQRELLRVARHLIVIEYEDMAGYQIVGRDW